MPKCNPEEVVVVLQVHGLDAGVEVRLAEDVQLVPAAADAVWPRCLLGGEGTNT